MNSIGFINHMIKSKHFNRSLQRKNWAYFKGKLDHIAEMERTKDGSGKVFNELFLDENRQAVVENRRRLAVELSNIQWENKVKTLISLVLTAILVLFCLTKWWI